MNGIANIASLRIKKVAEEADIGLVSYSTEETVNKIEQAGAELCQAHVQLS